MSPWGAPAYVRDVHSTSDGRDMKTYVILRRHGWRTGEELEAAATRSTAEGDRMADDVRWIRSYVLGETDGSVGTVCIYQATSPEAAMPPAQTCPSTRSSRSPTPSSCERTPSRRTAADDDTHPTREMR